MLPPLIPRETIFGNPEKYLPRLSPDGKRLAWIAPDSRNVLQVWVKTMGEDDDQIVTADKKRGIRWYFWARDNRTIFYLQDTDGDENAHLYGIDLEVGSVRDYTAFQNVQARITATNPDFADEVLVSMNVLDAHLHDVYRLTLSTGALVLDTENPGDVTSFFTDAHLQVRVAWVTTPDGGTELRVRRDAASAWETWLQAGPEEILQFLAFTRDGKSITLLSSLGSNTARVIEKNIETKEEKVIAGSPEVDAGAIFLQPRDHVVQAVAFEPARRRWTVTDPSVQADFDGIAKLHDGDFSVDDRDMADTTWIVSFTSDRGPARYYLWDRKSRTGRLLFVDRPKLDGLTLAAMKPVMIKSRDGLSLNGYLTLPPGVEPRRLPMVLLVHGGPWLRDVWGFHSAAQWLANRGYLCLQVNFRGSTGYGREFLNAGDRQWGLKMQDDLIDAVNWAVAEGMADPKKVAIFGGSYGGYAALVGVTSTPEFFACAVESVGPSNLKTLIDSIPPYWKPIRARFDAHVGNVDDPKDAELIKNASPLFRADKIVRPLLIGHGANDPRVKQAESEQIVAAIEKNGGRVIYVLYPDEGHGFGRPENNLDFISRAEAFLAEHIGGRCEPVADEKHPGSTAIVKVVGK
jgi:dipeptidyl aminopeptidase/acylaminoacyl peptidase